MENFTPWSALAGGALIGLSAGLLMLANGRVAGISGIIGGLFGPAANERLWRVAFLVGLLAGPVAAMALGVQRTPRIDASWPVLIAAGLLVGFGTRLGGGCTSGHGVCGMARLSPRSMVATGTFMAAGMAIVFVARHVVEG